MFEGEHMPRKFQPLGVFRKVPKHKLSTETMISEAHTPLLAPVVAPNTQNS